MAEANHADTPSPLPVEIIFSCQVCHTPISEIYGSPESDKGFRDGTHEEVNQAEFPSERPVTKLWLTECAHLTCGRHLDGGGIPLHRAGDRPQAACPICSSQKDDKRPKDLYGIRGWHKGSFDESIPESWFNTPPVKLEASTKGMEALRFQYLALVRFGTNIYQRYKDSVAAHEALEQRGLDDRAARSELQNQLRSMKERIRELEKCEEELKPWRERQSKIMYYLGVFQEVVRENFNLRQQMTALGYAVPARRYPFEMEPDGRIPSPKGQAHDYNPLSRGQQDTSSGRTLSGPVPQDAAVPNPRVPTDLSEFRGPPLKRRREDYENEPSQGETQLTPRQQLMPPPPRPSGPIFSPGQSERRTKHSISHTHRPDSYETSRIESGAALLNGNVRLFDDIPMEQAEGLYNTKYNPRMQEFTPAENQTKRTLYDHPRAFSLPQPDSHSYDSRTAHEKHPSPNRRIRDERHHTWDNTSHEEDHSLPEANIRTNLYGSQVMGSPSYDQSVRDKDHLGDSRMRHRVPLAQYTDSSTNVRPQSPVFDPRVDLGKRQGPFRASLSPQKSFQPVRPIHTPSPQKRERGILEDTDSITSPFYNPKSAQQYSGRMTLTDRSVSGNSSTGPHRTDAFAMPPPPFPSKRASERVRYPTQPFRSPTRSHPPALPSNNHLMPASSRKLLAPSTPRDAEGLFQRPEHSRPTSRYFPQQGLGTNMRDSISVRKNPFSNQQIPQLMPSTASLVRDKHYVPQAMHRNSGLERFQYTDSSAGIRSGKSKPSAELSRGAGNLSSRDVMAHSALGGSSSSMGLRRTARR